MFADGVTCSELPLAKAGQKTFCRTIGDVQNCGGTLRPLMSLADGLGSMESTWGKL